MMIADIMADEFTAATAETRRRHFDFLEGQGVPRHYLWGGSMRFGTAEIITSGTTYEPMPGGKRAFIVPAVPLRDDVFDDDVGDLIAWFPDNPSRWWHRFGLVPFLNFEAVERAAWFREPLSLWSTPLSWLRAAGKGAVILDNAVHLPLWFGGITDIASEDIALARRIKRAMQQQERRLPAFHVLDARAAA
jgi:hypothetical protein